MLKELVIKIYESEQCGFKYDIFDADDEKAESIDGGHCTSDLLSALKMAGEQALGYVALKQDEVNKANLERYNNLSQAGKDEVNSRIADQKSDDAQALEDDGDCWQGTEAQYLDWALEEYDENSQTCENCQKVWGTDEKVCPNCLANLGN